MDAAEQTLLTDSLRKTMATSTGAELCSALHDLGWLDLLTDDDTVDIAVPLVFRLLGETGAHAPLINDVVTYAAGRPFGEPVPLPFTGGRWVLWQDGPEVTDGSAPAVGVGIGNPNNESGSGRSSETSSSANNETSRSGGTSSSTSGSGGNSGSGNGVGRYRDADRAAALDPELPLRVVGSPSDSAAAEAVPLAHARRALGWWLTGSARAALGLARRHALERVQFGKPVAGFQAIRHRLAESLVAIEGAEAALAVGPADARHPAHPESAVPQHYDCLAAALAKAAAGRAALTTARHCQQVLGGIGFTAEHEFHRHYRRVLVLDGLLGSSRDLTREAGATLRELGYAPRLAQL
ncbi:acyl-CoA dehydrogenase family protein [Nocardia flavorosea]|uniref:acyl-CoA dehydrogenase family protein n=1 Tax=Nocardia flavorosea TaxID=53429 RepID=UPI002B4B4B45|nr:acyl-CoA dehydrogenase family protein [Nocardia flavorosea]